jgi:hypothetical protein
VEWGNAASTPVRRILCPAQHIAKQIKHKSATCRVPTARQDMLQVSAQKELTIWSSVAPHCSLYYGQWSPLMSRPSPARAGVELWKTSSSRSKHTPKSLVSRISLFQFQIIQVETNQWGNMR